MIDPEEEQRIERIAERLKNGDWGVKGWLPPHVVDAIADGIITSEVTPAPLIDWTAPMGPVLGNAVYDPVLEAIHILQENEAL